MKEVLIAHTNPDGQTGIAVVVIEAPSIPDAREWFHTFYPQRRISAVGIAGKEDL